MDASEFQHLISKLTAEVAGMPLNAELAARLNAEHGPGSETFASLLDACRQGITEGWMCQHEHRGLRYGRVVKPSDITHGFSVDVVDMDNIAGGRHRHPHGEIVLNMPLSGEPLFDGWPAGWSVNEPGTEHTPVVAGGHALVLYMLPQGAIEFVK